MFISVADVAEVAFEHAKRAIDELQEKTSFVRVEMIGHGTHVSSGVWNDEFAVEGLKCHVSIADRMDTKAGLDRSSERFPKLL